MGPRPLLKPGLAAIAVRAVTAPTAGKAHALAQAIALWRARKDFGIDTPVPCLDRAGQDGEWSEEERLALPYGGSSALIAGLRVHSVLLVDRVTAGGGVRGG